MSEISVVWLWPNAYTLTYTAIPPYSPAFFFWFAIKISMLKKVFSISGPHVRQQFQSGSYEPAEHPVVLPLLGPEHPPILHGTEIGQKELLLNSQKIFYKSNHHWRSPDDSTIIYDNWILSYKWKRSNLWLWRVPWSISWYRIRHQHQISFLWIDMSFACFNFDLMHNEAKKTQYIIAQVWFIQMDVTMFFSIILVVLC